MQGSQCFLCFQEIALDSNQGLYLDLRHLVHHHSLESLSLSNTELVSIDGINRAQNLKQIFAVGNQCMNGTLTEEISTLVQLEKLYLADNSLTGELPTDLFYMPNLEELDLSRNKFHGTIPHTIGSSPKLKTLLLPMNYLTGSLPSETREAWLATSTRLKTNWRTIARLCQCHKIAFHWHILQRNLPWPPRKPSCFITDTAIWNHHRLEQQWHNRNHSCITFEAIETGSASS